MKRLLLAIAVMFPLATCGEPELPPEIQTFLNEHPELDLEVRRIQDAPNWAEGQRWRARLADGRQVIFYERDGDIVTVRNPDFTDVWRSEDAEYSAVVEELESTREATDDLPEYEVLSAINLVRGGVYGEVLINEMSRSTPVEVREVILRKIAATEGFNKADLYCSRDAYQANMSASFLESHPDALRTCYLGGLYEQEFTPGEKFYP